MRDSFVFRQRFKPKKVGLMASICGSRDQYQCLRSEHFKLQDKYFKLHGQYFNYIGSTFTQGVVFQDLKIVKDYNLAARAEILPVELNY